MWTQIRTIGFVPYNLIHLVIMKICFGGTHHCVLLSHGVNS